MNEDWLHHSLRLIAARVAKMNEHTDTPEQQTRLRYELAMITYCVCNWEKSDGFTGEYAVWWAWLTQHAALQVERYAGRMDDQTFYAACDRIRKERDRV